MAPINLLRPSCRPWRGGAISLHKVTARLRDLLPPTFEDLDTVRGGAWALARPPCLRVRLFAACSQHLYGLVGCLAAMRLNTRCHNIARNLWQHGQAAAGHRARRVLQIDVEAIMWSCITPL